MWLVDLLIFILGLFIGSFLNVVIYRYGTGTWWRAAAKSGQRSKCFSCGQILSWYELVPLFSFVIQRGRCRKCDSKIAWQYPAVELLTGIIFWLVWWFFAGLEFSLIGFWLLLILYLCIFSLLIIILVYDLRHKIIPDGPVFAFIGLSLATVLVSATSRSRFNLDLGLLGHHLLAAAILFVFFWALWYFSDGRWMGFGDAKLVAGVGLLLGLQLGLTAIILAFWSGALVGVGMILFGKLLKSSRLRLGIKSEIPFAPFIIFGLVLVFFTQLNLFSYL